LRKAATILLLTVFCNSLFYYGYISCSLLKAKLDAKIALAKINSRASFDILRVAVWQLQKDESDEVWYDGKLYDVVERDRINDTQYVFLERDEEEQNILTRRQKCFQGNCGILAAGGNGVTATKMAVGNPDTEYITNYRQTFARHVSMIKSSPAVYTAPLSALFTETPSPPPKPA
jgi:hypothetical protein